jgi:mono/diheme cytochrome c family protein
MVVWLAGCRGTEIEDAIDKVDWFNNMRNQPAVEPFEEPARMPPEGTVHVDAGVPPGALPDDYEDVSNPAAATEASLERGKELYDIYCTVCHGPEGQGGGNIEGPYPRGLINMLTTERARGYTDGYLFGMISAGRGLMPNYRRIPQAERWEVVNYVRQLQEQAEAVN